MIKISIGDHNKLLKVVTFVRDNLLIGRTPEADICLPSPSVSRRHCRIERRQGKWRVSDSGSPNGVFMRRRGKSEVVRVVSEELSSGDRIQVDRFTLTFEEMAKGSPFDQAIDNMGSDNFGNELEELSPPSRDSMTDLVRLYETRQALEDAPVELETEAGPPIRQQTAEEIANNSGAFFALVPGAAVEGGLSERETQGVEIPRDLEAKPRVDFRVRIQDSQSGRDDTVEVSGEATVGTGFQADIALHVDRQGKEIGKLWRIQDRICFRRTTWWPFPRVFIDGKPEENPVLGHGGHLRIGSTTLEVQLG